MRKKFYQAAALGVLALSVASGCEPPAQSEVLMSGLVQKEFTSLLGEMDRAPVTAQYNFLTLVIQPDSSVLFRRGELPVFKTSLLSVPEIVRIGIYEAPNLIVGVEGHPNATWGQVFSLVEAVREARAERIFIGLPSLLEQTNPYAMVEVVFPDPDRGEVVWLHPGRHLFPSDP